MELRVTISDDLHYALKKRALEEHKTLKKLVIELLEDKK
jgi:hypothetical protein